MDSNNKLDLIGILSGKVCAYCYTPTRLVPNSKIHRDWNTGQSWVCPSCSARVGCHEGTSQAFGRTADGHLRKAKRIAHKYFDAMWRRKVAETGMRNGKARRNAYKWLSKQLDIPFNFTHIGMMNLQQCQKVAALCSRYYMEKYDKRLDIDAHHHQNQPTPSS